MSHERAATASSSPSDRHPLGNPRRLVDYTVRDRIHACWIGKAVGGTLGQSFEGLWGPLDVTFYDPIPTEMIPNDDLDLQVVWAVVISKMAEPSVDRHTLAAAWLEHVGFPWNEYGSAIRNLRAGIRPPWSGSVDNWFTAGEGAAIRSELWACLAAGDSGLAARYAYEDACVDHAGEGIYAAQFLAALEARAFVSSDPAELIAEGMRVIPADSGVAAVAADVLALSSSEPDWRVARQVVFEKYANGDITDVRMNTGFVLIGWLYGSDFEERIVFCNNCAGDTDSSTATLGALLGIMDPGSMPARWTDPIGEELVLSDPIVGVDAPATLSGFTDLVISVRDALAGRVPSPSEYPEPTPAAIAARIGATNDYRFHRYIGDSFLPPRDEPPRIALTPTTLEGTWTRWPRADFDGDVLVVEYDVTVPADDEYRIMFNTSEQCRVWIDGQFGFDRTIAWDGHAGDMWPATQHPPLHQSVDLRLAAGAHRVTAALRKPPLDRYAEWVVGVIQASDWHWVPGAFTLAGTD